MHQIQESEFELHRWQTEVRQACLRKLDGVEAERRLLEDVAGKPCFGGLSSLTLPSEVCSKALPVSSSAVGRSSPSSGAPLPPTSPEESPSKSEEDDIPGFLHTLACNDPSSSFSASSRSCSPSQLDAFYSLWRSCRRSCSCITMDLLRDQALRLLRICHAASAAAKKVSCSSTRAPRDLLLSHVTYRVLGAEEESGGGLADSGNLSALTDKAQGASPRQVSGVSGAVSSGSLSAQNDKTGSRRLHFPQSRDGDTATVAGSDVSGGHGAGLRLGAGDRAPGEELGGERRGGSEDQGGNERFFVPLATAAAVTEAAERRGGGDGTGEEGGTEGVRTGRRVLLRLKILGGFDVTCGGLRTPCLSSLADAQLAAGTEASSEGVEVAMEEADSSERPGGDKPERTVQATPSVGPSEPGGEGVSTEVQDGQDLELQKTAALDFILSTEDWRISVQLWPLHPMMSLFEARQEEKERGESNSHSSPAARLADTPSSSSLKSPVHSGARSSSSDSVAGQFPRDSASHSPATPDAAVASNPAVRTAHSVEASRASSSGVARSGYLSEADRFALSVLQSQPCWRALKQWEAGQLQLEVWLQNAAAALGLLQLLTVAYHLLHPTASPTAASSRTFPTIPPGCRDAPDTSRLDVHADGSPSPGIRSLSADEGGGSSPGRS